MLNSSDRPLLRRALRQQRNDVPKAVQDTTARAVARSIVASQLLRTAQRIAVYSAFDGEIDLAGVIAHAKRIGCTVYAPRIVTLRSRKMHFIEIDRVALRKLDTRSLVEPRMHLHRRVDPRLLDIVFVPLVAFDDRGWRLGFGAGFYDRAFAFKRRTWRRRPLLVGVAYEFQRVSLQKPSPWDVLLDAVVTERGLKYFNKR